MQLRSSLSTCWMRGKRMRTWCPRGSSSSLRVTSSTTSLILCSSTAESCSDLRISSRSWLKRLKIGALLRQLSCPVRRKSWTKKLKLWLTPIVGLSSRKKASVTLKLIPATHTCSSSQKFLLIRRLTAYFMKRCWPSLWRRWRRLLTFKTWQN